MALVHTGLYKAAINIPTTDALIPASAVWNPGRERRIFQNGSAPETSKNAGKKIAISASILPTIPLGYGFDTKPR